MQTLADVKRQTAVVRLRDVGNLYFFRMIFSAGTHTAHNALVVLLGIIQQKDFRRHSINGIDDEIVWLGYKFDDGFVLHILIDDL